MDLLKVALPQIFVTMLSNAEFYSENQSLQLYDAKLFLESVKSKIDSPSLDEGVMMDLGCGPGNTCLKVLLPTFPGVRKIVGVDISEHMIEFAKRHNFHEKIEYHVCDIEDRNTILKCTEKASRVISIHCFHWLQKQKEAFENIYQILKPGGKAALIFILNSPFWDSYHLHYSNPKYRKYLENKRSYIPESHFQKHDAVFYRNQLEDIGFDVIVCEEENRIYTYPNDDVCRASLYSICGLTNYIPDDLRPEFKEDNFQYFLMYNDRCSDR
nr:juvenile hormone acid methyltransferase-4 [Pardosa pseudoannulata]